MLFDRDLELFEGWRYRRADGVVARIFLTSKRDAMALAGSQRILYPTTRTVTKPKLMTLDQGS